MSGTDSYTPGDVFQLCVQGAEVESVIDDWNQGRFATDIRLRRAKTKGYVVIETTDALFAQRVLMWHPSTRVHIKKKV